MKTKLFFTGLAFVALTTIVSAQTTSPAINSSTGNTGQRTAYVDANNNGVCDNFENNGGQHRGNAAGQGKGQGKGTGMGNRTGNGRGNRPVGSRAGRTNAAGPNFIDKDKNGICDNRESTTVK